MIADIALASGRRFSDVLDELDDDPDLFDIYAHVRALQRSRGGGD